MTYQIHFLPLPGRTGKFTSEELAAALRLAGMNPEVGPDGSGYEWFRLSPYRSTLEVCLSPGGIVDVTMNANQEDPESLYAALDQIFEARGFSCRSAGEPIQPPQTTTGSSAPDRV